MHVTWHTSIENNNNYDKVCTIRCSKTHVRNWVTITLLHARDKLTLSEAACLRLTPTTKRYFDWAIFFFFSVEKRVFYKSRCKFSVKKIINNVTRRLHFPDIYDTPTHGFYFFLGGGDRTQKLISTGHRRMWQ